MENRKQKEENEMEIDLVSLFFYLIDKWKLLFLGAVVGVVLAGALVFFQTPMYESNSTLYVLSKTTSITSMADLQVGTELTSDNCFVSKIIFIENISRVRMLGYTFFDFL